MTQSHKGNAAAALERLDADALMDVSSQLQAARQAYFNALDTNEDVDRTKFTCTVSHPSHLGFARV